MSPYVKEAWRSLYATKQRTALALLGIVIGIGAVIALVSIGRIVTNEATKQFREMGTDMLTLRLAVAGDDRSLNDPGLTGGLAAHVSCLRLAAPFTRSSAGLPKRPGEQDVNAEKLGVTDGFFAVNKLQLAAGRLISSLDGSRRFVVLGAELPRLLGLSGPPDGLVGREISLEDGRYTVVGVLAPAPESRQTRVEPDTAFFVPLATTLGGGRHPPIRDVAARIRPTADEGQCVKAVEQYFLRRNPAMKLRVVTAEELIERMRKQGRMFNVLLAAIAGISLVVGGVGIMNIMLMSVTERRQEIGIRRALGARRKEIRYQFLIEAMLLSMVGGVLGIGVGVGASYVVSEVQAWEFFVSWQSVVLGAGVSALIGIFFGFFPAHQAAGLDPITALRAE
ncbi:ABC transporter permease [Endothiovibrio diazotrophicus]